MKLKYIKTLIFVMIFVVFAAGSIYNYKKPSTEAPEIIKFFDTSPSEQSLAVQQAAASDAEETDLMQVIPGTESSDKNIVLININTADRAELESLPGIGPVKAKAIMEYRSKYKGFVAPEEIMEVKGIGPATYEKIKDKITTE